MKGVIYARYSSYKTEASLIAAGAEGLLLASGYGVAIKNDKRNILT